MIAPGPASGGIRLREPVCGHGPAPIGELRTSLRCPFADVLIGAMTKRVGAVAVFTAPDGRAVFVGALEPEPTPGDQPPVRWWLWASCFVGTNSERWPITVREAMAIVGGDDALVASRRLATATGALSIDGFRREVAEAERRGPGATILTTEQARQRYMTAVKEDLGLGG